MSKRAIEAEATRRIEAECRVQLERQRRIDAFNAALNRDPKRSIDEIIAEANTIKAFVDGGETIQ